MSTVSLDPPLFDQLACSLLKVAPGLCWLGVAEKEWEDVLQPWEDSWKDTSTMQSTVNQVLHKQ